MGHGKFSVTRTDGKFSVLKLEGKKGAELIQIQISAQVGKERKTFYPVVSKSLSVCLFKAQAC